MTLAESGRIDAAVFPLPWPRFPRWGFLLEQRKGPRNEQEHRHEGKTSDRKRPDLIQIEPRRKKDEEPRDQKNAKVLFEFENMPDVHPTLIGQGESHNGRCEKAGLMLQMVG